MGDTKKHKKDDGKPDPMTRILKTFTQPTTTDWDNAWVGIEPTFQSKKSVALWRELAAKGHVGEDEYFKDRYMLGMQREVAEEIVKKYESKRKDGKDWCVFEDVKREEQEDQWKVKRQNLVFKWKDKDLPKFEVRFTIDPETFEYSIKPVPVAWFYDPRFVRFLDELVWEVPMKKDLCASIAHGGAQFSFSAKTFLTGSLLADDIATKLNHPELATWMMDWPNPDDRPFRATRKRFEAFRRVLDAYWDGGFHPKAIGVLTALDVFLDRGWGPAANPPKGLMDAKKGPCGDALDVFRTNFAFGRAVRLQAQAVDPGYWQSAHPAEEGYRPDQIMRYSEGNLNRMQIAGEFHVKSGKTLDAERVPQADDPLEPGMLYDEASWEDRGQMGRTSAQDFVEALLLDVHAAKWLQKNPGVKVKATMEQDRLLGDAEKTLLKHDAKTLEKLKRAAEKANKEASRDRLKSDWVEPEDLFWAAWRALPAGDKAEVAREAVTAFVERVENAASVDPRADKPKDAMEGHRHRVHPELWKALAPGRAQLKPDDPAKRELEAWEARKDEMLKRRPVFSQVDPKAPWD